MSMPVDAVNKPKVFVSYSRDDLEFADQLVAFLEWQGFQAVIDGRLKQAHERLDTLTSRARPQRGG